MEGQGSLYQPRPFMWKSRGFVGEVGEDAGPPPGKGPESFLPFGQRLPSRRSAPLCNPFGSAPRVAAAVSRQSHVFPTEDSRVAEKASQADDRRRLNDLACQDGTSVSVKLQEGGYQLPAICSNISHHDIT
ncbi:hypothetical protein CLCR_07698 [Cladophialophora carrionii]|uniref:Uncharacterized protein n=1 Tax=Cladophialophora carrionii TaxID=86049 RepID=A0A1C1CQQ2_9EURO|nr:hypothetical protein CLCR_07698 [Cladophialophora carrionii]